MAVNWGLGQQGGGSFIDSWNRGMATAGALETQQRQRAAAEQQQRTQAEARGLLGQGRDLDAARLLAGSGQHEEANALRAIFQQQTERATTVNGAMVNIINVVDRLPYEQRRAAIQQAAPFLISMGASREQIDNYDPTSTNNAAMARMFYTREMEEDDNRQSFEANTGRISSEAAQFNALHPQVDGTLLEYGPDGQARVVYRREKFNVAPVDSDVYVEPGVMPSQAPANRLPVQGQPQQPQGPAAFNTGRLPVNGMPQPQFAQQPQQQQFVEQAPQEAPAEGELYVPGGENWGRPEGQAQAPQAAPTGEVQVGNLTVPSEWMVQDRPVEQPTGQRAPERQQVALPYGRAGFGVSNREQLQNTFYDEYRQQGATHEGALTMVAQIGRENGYDPTIIFGQHRDANRRAGTNVGAISWNRDRRTRFLQAMTEQGFYRNGRLEVSQESARAQARYSMQEMQERYPASYRVMTTEGLGYAEIEPTLSTNYYGWDRSGSAVLGTAGARQHRDRMEGYYQTASRGFNAEGGSEYQQANASTGQPAPQGEGGMGYRRVTQGRQRPARPAPAQGQWRNATPEELRARGYAPGTVVQIGPNGQEQVRQQPPRGRAGNQQGQDGRDQMVSDSMRRVVETAQSLIRHPGFSSAVGFPNILRGNLGPMGMVPGTDAYNFRAEVETLKNQQFLPMVQALRGMGALSNAEGARLEQSIASLDLGQGEEQFRANLNRILSDLSRYAPIPVTTVRQARQLPQGTYVRLPNGSVRRVN